MRKTIYETMRQASERSELSVRSLRRKIASGELVAYRMGRTIRLRPEDVDALFTPTNLWTSGAA